MSFGKKAKIFLLNNQTIVDSFLSYNRFLLKPLEDKNENEEVKEMFIYMCTEYDACFIEKKEFIKENLPRTSSLYKTLNLKEFDKWKLIPVDINRNFIIDRSKPFVYDKNLDKSFLLCIPSQLAPVFQNLSNDGLIGQLSLRSNDKIFEGFFKNNDLCEEVETGKIFDYDFKKTPQITKMYDENLNNQFWAFKDGNQFIFEELLDNFSITGNFIKTQVIHLEFDESKKVITHIDKEDVFYTEEEYTERLEKNVKGKGKKRIKYFKINEANIPFDYPCRCIDIKTNKEVNVPFIYFVVDSFFAIKNNVKEYFFKLL